MAPPQSSWQPRLRPTFLATDCWCLRPSCASSGSASVFLFVSAPLRPGSFLRLLRRPPSPCRPEVFANQSRRPLLGPFDPRFEVGGLIPLCCSLWFSTTTTVSISYNAATTRACIVRQNPQGSGMPELQEGGPVKCVQYLLDAGADQTERVSTV